MFGKLSAAILSGGLSSRMQGMNKSFLEMEGRYFLEILLQTLRPLFSEILLVTRTPRLYEHYNLKIVQDIYPTQCSLTGIHAALTYSPSSHTFITACDTPLVKRDLISILIQELSAYDEVVVPKHGVHFEPLCAIYSRTCIPCLEYLLSNNNLKISELYHYVRTKEIPSQRLICADPKLESFVNINTPRDLELLNSHYSRNPD